MALRILILEDILNFLSMLDSPGTYIMCIVFAMIIIPFYVKGVHEHLKNPQAYYMVSFEKKLWAGFIIIIVLFIFGVVNFIRFLP
ncbi:MAG: hypothetical protein V3U72_00040 [Candidatus Aenigmarchaeota archaeon]